MNHDELFENLNLLLHLNHGTSWGLPRLTTHTHYLPQNNAIIYIRSTVLFQVVEFLGRHRVEGGTSEAIDAAAANGHLDVVRWLTENVPDMHATTRAMDTAACEGHLEMVKFLHESRQEGCTTEAMDSAARRGHLEVRTRNCKHYVLQLFAVVCRRQTPT